MNKNTVMFLHSQGMEKDCGFQVWVMTKYPCGPQMLGREEMTQEKQVLQVKLERDGSLEERLRAG